MDLGTLQGEVLVFGGNYSNLQATQALQQVAKERQIPPQRIICTGDIVAYCAQPEETVQLMRDWDVPVVMGNCEESLGFEGDDCGCGFAEGTACAILSDSWFNYSRRRVSNESKAWMRALPREIRFELGGKHFQVVHGGVTSINQFLFASLADTVFAEELAKVEADVVIGGHAGMPFVRSVAGKTWLNSGVIGMPANEGVTQTWYMLLNVEQGSVSVRWQRLVYAAEAASQVMVERGLDNAYAQALLTGLWPSMDVLPEWERSQRGKSLVLDKFTLH